MCMYICTFTYLCCVPDSNSHKGYKYTTERINKLVDNYHSSTRRILPNELFFKK